MTLTKQVARLVAERGEASADDLLPLIPGRTRRQVIRTMQNAAASGLIELARVRCLGRGHGRLPGIYRPATAPREKKAPAPRIRAASVWDYAQQI